MSPETFLDGRVTLWQGDCLDRIKEIPDNSVDSCVTDPPYALVSIVKRFGKPGSAPAKSNGATGVYARASAGFMGANWDNGSTAFDPKFWAEVLRVLKPGAHLVAFSGTRTYHRMACAIEDAGAEIRDQLAFCYGSGFPKSHDVSKGIDRTLGMERGKVRVDASQVRNPTSTGGGRDGLEGATRPWIENALERGWHEAVSDEAVSDEAVSDEAVSDEAVSWRGWGTALKPAWEPIVLARKPLIGTVATNVLQHGTGALNIDGCRVEGEFKSGWSESGSKASDNIAMSGANYDRDPKPDNAAGRWPANICHDGSEEVLAAFPETSSGVMLAGTRPKGDRNTYGRDAKAGYETRQDFGGDSGSAARFFFTSKADSVDRAGSRHPTVKPLDLMQWLVRLVTPPGGLILDPFAGTGTTAEAAYREGFRAVLIEREDEYCADIRRRMALALAGPEERARESIKARGLTADAGPLFGGLSEPIGGGRNIYGVFADEKFPRRAGPSDQSD